MDLDPDNEDQYIVWGVGGLGETAFRHFVRAEGKEHSLVLDHTDVVVITAGDPPLHLGRASSSDCVPLQCSSCDPYQNQRIEAPSNTTFVAQIGPSGDQRGYMGITGEETTPLISNSNQVMYCYCAGSAGWGIAWYINDTLIPELVVQRGQTYTFIVYGGDDPNNPAQYHPFYITNSPSGGRDFNTLEQNAVRTDT